MTIYYVRKSGSDAANGTTPALAWLTIGKALGATGISSGDTVYIGAGVYREKITCALTSPVAETFVIGDVSGTYTGDAGEIRITNYLTDDTTLPTDQAVLDPDGRDYLTFQSLTFHALFTTLTVDTHPKAVDATTPARNITFRDCTFNVFSMKRFSSAIYCSADVDDVMNWLIERCHFLLGNADVQFVYSNTDSHTDDFDSNLIVRNCQFIGGSGVTYHGAGTSVEHYAGGMIVRNCLILADCGTNITSTFTSLSYPTKIYNCIIINNSGYNGIAAGSEGEIVADYNITFVPWSACYSSVTPGGNSIDDGSYAPLIHFGQELQQGLSLRPFGMPTADSPLLGFGDDGNAPSVDILNRPRPAGGQSTAKAVGAYERHDTAVAETSVFDVTPAIKIVGPGDHDFHIPVDATATTISIKARYDANHAATNKPQAILLAQPEIGVSAETKTMTAAADTWQTLTFAPITPTAAGVVTVRLVSRAAAGNGIAYFDSATAT